MLLGRRRSISKVTTFAILFISACSIFFATLQLAAQGTAGSIFGTIKDESGAVIPGVSIKVTNTATGIARDAISGDSGRYEIPALASGKYDVQAELPGFKRGVRGGVTLNVGQQQLVDFTLQVGDSAQEVTVSD